MTSLGKLTVPHTHLLSTKGGFKISVYLQELGCYMGQLNVFDQASATLEKLTGILLSDKQIERLCHYYGQQQEAVAPFEGLVAQDESLHYAMADGAMLLTREKDQEGVSKWAEIKLGRVFRADSHLSTGQSAQSRHWIKESQYVAHLGDCDAFFDRLMPLLDPLKKLIFVADGASWIWQRVENYYPDAVQILDYYHAVEHLWTFLACCDERFAAPEDKKRWAEEQKNLLLENHLQQVMDNIAQLNLKNSKAREEQRKLLTYYSNNQSRMCYGDYLSKGWLIGSGPIESAHREVIQKRMKRSGQRWTLQGAQQLANLRVAYKSNQWQQIIDSIKQCA